MSKSNVLLIGSQNFYGKSVFKELSKTDKFKVVNLPEGLDAAKDPEGFSLFLQRTNIDSVVDTGGLSFGIQGNIEFPATLFMDNLKSLNSISLAHEARIKKYIFFGSSCCYPRSISVPMTPSMLFSGPLEVTNQSYASIKLAGMELCQAISKEFGFQYQSIIPANVYGPHDDFSDANSHVIGALIKKISIAKAGNEKNVELWGTGKPIRDFIFIDDLARGVVQVLSEYTGLEPVNIGSGKGTAIIDLAEIIADILRYDGEIKFNTSMPDGVAVKVLDSSCISGLGWSPLVDLRQGLCDTLDWLRTFERRP